MEERQDFDIGRENHVRGHGVLNILPLKAEVCYVSLPPQVSSSRVHFAGVCCLTKLHIQRQELPDFPTSSLHNIILKLSYVVSSASSSIATSPWSSTSTI